MRFPDFPRTPNFQSRFSGYMEFSQHGLTVSKNMIKFASTTDKDYRKNEQNTSPDSEFSGK